MDCLCFAGHGHNTFARFVAAAFKRRSRSIAVKQLAAVVVTELDEHEITGLELGVTAVPTAFREEGPAAAATDRLVMEVDPLEIEVGREHLSPTPQAAGAIAATVLDRRVANEE
jgi:hypothetical protein